MNGAPTTSNKSSSHEIDFVAYHDLQAQVGLSAFQHLSESMRCNWLIGPHSRPSPRAVGAVMLDHSCFQRNVRKGSPGYRYLFHVPHDLADLSVYRGEDSLGAYDILFTPTALHSAVARNCYRDKTKIVETGWPKYDLMAIPDSHKELANTLQSLPYPVTVLYAPTEPKYYEWQDLFPTLLNYPGINVIVKNHICVNPGQPYPAGLEEDYACALRSADEMERAVTSMHSGRLVVAPRTLNICSLFPSVDLVISDSSSVLAEFLPFRNSVETGRHGRGISDCVPEISKIFPDIKYVPTQALLEILSRGRLHELVQPRPPRQPRDRYGLLRPAAGRRIADEIVRHLAA